MVLSTASGNCCELEDAHFLMTYIHDPLWIWTLTKHLLKPKQARKKSDLLRNSEISIKEHS